MPVSPALVSVLDKAAMSGRGTGGEWVSPFPLPFLLTLVVPILIALCSGVDLETRPMWQQVCSGCASEARRCPIVSPTEPPCLRPCKQVAVVCGRAEAKRNPGAERMALVAANAARNVSAANHQRPGRNSRTAGWRVGLSRRLGCAHEADGRGAFPTSSSMRTARMSGGPGVGEQRRIYTYIDVGDSSSICFRKAVPSPPS